MTQCEATCLNKNVCKWVNCIYRHPLVTKDNVQLFEKPWPLTTAIAVAIFESLEPRKCNLNKKNKAA